jgi:Skp family chaperone for outer membrane proteins
LFAATVVASLLAACLASDVHAQGAPRPATGSVRVIDISYIFKNHVRFKQYMEQMRGEVQRAEETLKGERDRIAAIMEQQKSLKPNTPEYTQLGDRIIDEQTEFSKTAAKQKAEFLDREAKIYFMVYSEINRMVESYAKAMNVSLVLRYNSEPVDQTDRQSVLKAINRPIVHLGPNMDITQEILTELNRGAPQADLRGGGVSPKTGPTQIQR